MLIPRLGTKKLISTEVCEQIIDFVAVRADSVDGWSAGKFWGNDVRATLQACSLTCRAWRSRSQLHLMRDMSVRASIAGSRNFHDLRALLHTIPLLQGNVEALAVEGRNLDVPRFHLVPTEIHTTLPTVQSLTLRGGLVYMPTVFFVYMRRFKHLARLFLHETTFISMHDLRRMLESLHSLKILALERPGWMSNKLDHPPRTGPGPPQSHVRLEILQLEAEAKWITDTRSIEFLDWLSSSGTISEIHDLQLTGLMLIDANIMAAVSRMLDAAQKSSQLSAVDILFGPEVDLTPSKF